MPKQTITIEVDVPKGYEATGDYYRPPSVMFTNDDFAVSFPRTNERINLYLFLRKLTPPPVDKLQVRR